MGKKHRPAADRPTLELRDQVMWRDRRRCRYCGLRASTLDHVLPYARGGGHGIDNLVACCKPCNLLKGSRTPEEAGMTLLPPEQAPSSAVGTTLPEVVSMPGKKYRSIRRPKQYEKLRSLGFSKSSSAAISNASYNKAKARKRRKR